LKVWDLETGRVLRTLEGHSSYVTDVAFSADVRRVVSASDDKTLRVWDLETGMPLTAFTCDGRVVSCVFIGDDKLFAGDSGGLVHFLSLEEAVIG
jgi:WD40 repeat protein